MNNDHAIFDAIVRGDLEAVKQHVRADPAVMDERESSEHASTPLVAAIDSMEPAIALWLIENRGQHDLNTATAQGLTALILACAGGRLPVVKALVAAGATPISADGISRSLILAGHKGENDIMRFLLQLPAVKANIDITWPSGNSFLSFICSYGNQQAVQLLLDAGADITCPAGQLSPLNTAISKAHHAVAALLRNALAELQRPRLLFKARALLDAAHKIREIQAGRGGSNDEEDDENKPRRSARLAHKRNAIAGAPAYLTGRVGRKEPLPRVSIVDDEEEEDNEEERGAVVRFVLNVNGEGLPREVFTELLKMVLPAWDPAWKDKPLGQGL